MVLATINGIFSLSPFSLPGILFSQKGLSYGSETLHWVITENILEKWRENLSGYLSTFLPSPPKHVYRKIPLVSMGGRAEGPACADLQARTPIGASEIYL